MSPSRSLVPPWEVLSVAPSSHHSSENEAEDDELDDLQSQTSPGPSVPPARKYAIARKTTGNRPPQRQKAKLDQRARNNADGCDDLQTESVSLKTNTHRPATQSVAPSGNRRENATSSSRIVEVGSTAMSRLDNAQRDETSNSRGTQPRPTGSSTNGGSSSSAVPPRSPQLVRKSTGKNPPRARFAASESTSRAAQKPLGQTTASTHQAQQVVGMNSTQSISERSSIRPKMSLGGRRPSGEASASPWSQKQRRHTLPAEIQIIHLSSSDSDTPSKSKDKSKEGDKEKMGLRDNPFVIGDSDDDGQQAESSNNAQSLLPQVLQRSPPKPASVLDTPPAIRPIPRLKPKKSSTARLVPGRAFPLQMANNHSKKSAEKEIISLLSDDDNEQDAQPRAPRAKGSMMSPSHKAGPSKSNSIVKQSPATPRILQNTTENISEVLGHVHVDEREVPTFDNDITDPFAMHVDIAEDIAEVTLEQGMQTRNTNKPDTAASQGPSPFAKPPSTSMRFLPQRPAAPPNAADSPSPSQHYRSSARSSAGPSSPNNPGPSTHQRPSLSSIQSAFMRSPAQSRPETVKDNKSYPLNSSASEDADTVVESANIQHKPFPGLWKEVPGSPPSTPPNETKIHKSDFSEVRKIKMANATLSPGIPGSHAVAKSGDQALALAVDPGATGSTGSTPTRVAQAVSMQITTSISTVASDGEAIAVDETDVDENRGDGEAEDSHRKRFRSHSLEVSPQMNSQESAEVRPVFPKRASKRPRRVDVSSDMEVDACDILAIASSLSASPPNIEDGSLQPDLAYNGLPPSGAHSESEEFVNDVQPVSDIDQEQDQPRRTRLTRSRSSGAHDITDGIEGIDLSFDVSRKRDTMSMTPQRKVYGKEYAPTHVLARNIPRGLAKIVDHMDWWQYNPKLLRDVFENAMVANTTPDEPDAPCIGVYNNIDDEPSPPFEFYYSNLMWHGEGVPPPDWQNLEGCDCFGPCDPYGDCACARRQKEAMREGFQLNGFIYDAKGRLKIDNFPIFECNDKCQCTDDCKNRVVQNGRKVKVNIIKTNNKGWGVFAGQRIPKGTFIGVYSGELITENSAEIRGHLYNKVGRTYLFDLDFWHLHEGEEKCSKYTVDAFHAGNFTRFLNHSCDPNCRINACYINEANKDKPLLAVFASRDITENEEICFSYFGDSADDDETENEGTEVSASKSAALKDVIYQRCQCGSRDCAGRIFQ